MLLPEITSGKKRAMSAIYAVVSMFLDEASVQDRKEKERVYMLQLKSPSLNPLFAKFCMVNVTVT